MEINCGFLDSLLNVKCNKLLLSVAVWNGEWQLLRDARIRKKMVSGSIPEII